MKNQYWAIKSEYRTTRAPGSAYGKAEPVFTAVIFGTSADADAASKAIGGAGYCNHANSTHGDIIEINFTRDTSGEIKAGALTVINADGSDALPYSMGNITRAARAQFNQ